MLGLNNNNAFDAPRLNGGNDRFGKSGLLAGNDDPFKDVTIRTHNYGSGVIPQNLTPEERSTERFNSSFANYLAPSFTPQRAKGVYALSQSALNDVVGNYYNNDLKGKFTRNRDISKARGEEAYMRYISVPGADPVMAQRAMMREYDPMKIVNNTMDEVDNDKLLNMVTPLANYGGMDAQEYLNSVVKPSLRDKLVDEFIQENTPKSRGEYILRSAMGNSLVGTLSQIADNAAIGNNSHSQFSQAGLAGYNAGRIDNFLAGAGSLLIDAPAFSFLGGASSAVVGNLTSKATQRLATRILAGRVGTGMTQQYATKIAERAIVNKLSTRILQSTMTQGLTLGNYDVANSIANDILYNDAVNWDNAVSSFGKGFATGAAVGVVGTPLRHASRGLTGGKKMAASLGVLSAESAVFTASGEAEKLLHGVEISPIDLLYDFGESAATLGIMKMTHWRPTGGETKLGNDGRLKPEYRLTKSEMDEIKELNVNADEFISGIERELRLPSLGSSGDVEAIKNNYIRLMSSNDLSASTRAKLLFLVENRLTSTPPVVFDYSVKNTGNNWDITLYDPEGRKISTESFENPGNAKSYLMVERGNIRMNRISAFERELTSGAESQNFLRQAGLYANEKGIPVDEMSEVLYKRAQGEPLDACESEIVGDVLERSAYDETGMLQYLSNKRREIENKYRLHYNSLLAAADKPFYRCSNSENKALDEYEAFVRSEVNRLKTGTNEVRSMSFAEMGRRSDLRGMSSEEVRQREVDNFLDYGGVVPGPYSVENATALTPEQQERERAQLRRGNSIESFTKPVNVPVDNNSEYVWNLLGNRNTRADIERYRKRAEDLAGKYGHDIVIYSDESEIPRPNENDFVSVSIYNNNVRALGWNHDGKVYLNLPNMKSVEEVEKTVVHEVVCHSGFSKLFGNHLRNFLEEVYSRASPEVLQGIKKSARLYRFQDSYIAVEEYLASLTEKTVTTSEERSLLRRFKDFVRSMLLRLNIYSGRNRKITEEHLEYLIRGHARYMRQRVAPEQYRSELFGEFKSANREADTYTDRNAYGKWVHDASNDGSFFANSPSFLLNYKGLYNYQYLPEHKKAEFRRRWDNITEEELQNALDYAKYKLPGDGENRSLSDYMSRLLGGFDRELESRYSALRAKPMEQWSQDDYNTWNRIADAGVANSYNVKLKDIAGNDVVFEKYPQLAGIPVEVVSGMSVPVYYDNRNKKLAVDKNLFINPRGGAYLQGALREIVRDYEGFNSAVHFNIEGLNDRLYQQYSEAQRMLMAMETAKRNSSDFDNEGVIAGEFLREYNFTPQDFRHRFPSFDDYLIYRLTGKSTVPVGREPENDMISYGMGVGVKKPQENTSAANAAFRDGGLKRYFSGPLDIIYNSMPGYNSRKPVISGEPLPDSYRDLLMYYYLNNPENRSNSSFDDYLKHRQEYEQWLREGGARRSPEADDNDIVIPN